jgi:hypothetical protein
MNPNIFMMVQPSPFSSSQIGCALFWNLDIIGGINSEIDDRSRTEATSTSPKKKKYE